MTSATFLDEPPLADTLTTYDRQHMAAYLRLLDAEMEGTPWKEVAQRLFGLDPKRDPERSARVYTSHLARAKWISQHGYRELVKTRLH